MILGNNGISIGYGNIQTDNKDTSDVYMPSFDMPGPIMEELIASVTQMLKEGKNVTGILSYGAYCFLNLYSIIHYFNALSKALGN